MSFGSDLPSRNVSILFIQHIYSSLEAKYGTGALSNEMMGLIGMGNNPMVGATVAVAVSVSQA